MDPQHPFAVIPGGARDDRDELARLREEIGRRNQQETAIAELGQAALTGVDPMILLGQACALVELTLSVSHVRDTIAYIEGQEAHHQKQSFEDEFRAFLIKHGIEFDERYVWG